MVLALVVTVVIEEQNSFPNSSKSVAYPPTLSPLQLYPCRTTERKEESATQHVHERTGFLAGTSTSKTVTRITEHFWKFAVDWSVTAFAGTGAEESITLLSRTGRCELMTVGKDKHTPAPEVLIRPSTKLDVSFLLANLTAEEGSVDFSINRAQATCHTPRRNEQTDSAINFMTRLQGFTDAVIRYFGPLMGKEKNLNPIPSADIFSPVLAMFVFEGGGESPTLSDMDFNKFLLEHGRQLSNHKDQIAKGESLLCTASFLRRGF